MPVHPPIPQKIVPPTNIKSTPKNLLSKSYPPHITPKPKLLQKQKPPKPKIKPLPNLQIPQHPFLPLLKIHHQ
ncbi:hypothetical protein [Staphylococcus epidermidis]|uniref:hypothetical protein n=1 Tax=Staphylococcus epidermidis TaxID=1282 RepID=UPI0037D9B56D